MDLRHGNFEFCAFINSQADLYAKLSTSMCRMHVGAHSHSVLLTPPATETADLWPQG